MKIPDHSVEPIQRIMQSVVSYRIKEHKSSVLKGVTEYDIQREFKLFLLNCLLHEKNHWQ